MTDWKVLPALAWFSAGTGFAHLMHSDLLIWAGLHARAASTGAPLGTYDFLVTGALLVIHWLRPVTFARKAMTQGERDA